MLDKDTRRFVNEFLVCIMVIHAISSETSFEFLQVGMEAILLISFTFLLANMRFNAEEVFLLGVFIISQVGSLVLNDMSVFLLNFKQLGLAIFATIYFRRFGGESRVLYIVFLLCLALVFIQYFITHEFPIDVSQYITTFKEWTSYKPLGLFLNYHYSAYFLAVFFIGFHLRNRLYFIDYFILILMDVKTSILSFIGQRVMHKVKSISPIMGTYIAQFITTFVVVALLMFSIPVAIKTLEFFNLSHGDSAYIIFSQITDPKTYLNALSFFPQDVYKYYSEISLYDYSDINGSSEHTNELFLVAVMVQAGAPLAFAYLYFMTKSLPNYRVFIFLSLLHFAYILSPLIIYIMFMFEAKNNNTFYK